MSNYQNNNMSTTFPGPVTLGTLTASTITTTNTGVGAYTISNPVIFDSAAMTVAQSGRLELSGDQADLVINGASLNDTLRGIQERLNLLTINPALEAEWDRLHELGQQYRKLEAELLEKQRMWEIMKK
jgi:hypothetical protein